VTILCTCLHPILTLLCDCHSIRIQDISNPMFTQQLRSNSPTFSKCSGIYKQTVYKVRSMLATLLMFIYSSIYDSCSCSALQTCYFFHIFPLFLSKMSTTFRSYSVHIICIYLVWNLLRFGFLSFDLTILNILQ
jgi:hypothetical protein